VTAPSDDTNAGAAASTSAGGEPVAARAGGDPPGDDPAARAAALAADNERLRELLAAAGRLAEFGRFAAQQIHELRQPLFAIRGLSQLLLEKERVDLEEVLDFARHISDQSERLTTLVSSMRQMAVPAPRLTKRRTELGPILVRVTSLLEFRLRKGTTMRTHVAPDLPPLVVSAHGLEQILINLIANALDAVDGVASPLIQVRAQRVVHDPRFAEVEVADNGSGVAKAVRAKLFESFFTTKGEEKGTGLGLAVSREIARSMGGDLVLLDQPGQWKEQAVTVFRLTLPVSQEF
jgi:two-component system C4-dicarboxylate transport sensor histidine kinase DctB